MTVPTVRARDVTREIDLIEEVARIVLDRVPHTMPLRRSVVGHLSREQRLRRLVEDVLVGAGFSEAYTWSLVATDPDPARDSPARSDERRSGDSPHDAARGPDRGGAENVDAGNEDIALFELARVYLPSGEKLPEERWRVGGIVAGGFEAARGAVEVLYETLHLELRPSRTVLPFLHPGKAATTAAGWLGELHPALLEGTWGVFELDLDELTAPIPERILYDDVITFPPLRQDIAVVVAEDVEAAALVDGGARGRGARAPRGACLRRLPRRPGGRGPEVGRHPPLAAGARPDAVGRRRRPSSGRASSTALVERFDGELRA